VLVLSAGIARESTLQLESTPMTSDYDDAFNDGLSAAVALARAGATADGIGALLSDGPGRKDPAAYQAHLAELRRIMRTDLFAEATP